MNKIWDALHQEEEWENREAFLEVKKIQKHVLENGFHLVMAGLRNLRLDLSFCGQMIKVHISHSLVLGIRQTLTQYEIWRTLTLSCNNPIIYPGYTQTPMIKLFYITYTVNAWMKH